MENEESGEKFHENNFFVEVLYSFSVDCEISLWVILLWVNSIRCPRVRGSIPPLGTLGNMSENQFLGSTQAM